MSVIEPAISPLFNAAAGAMAAVHAPERQARYQWTFMTWLACIAALGIFAAAAATVWLLNDMVVPWDSKNQFYPFYRFLGDSLHGGKFPMWNPYHFGGHPSIADPQSLLFSPSMLALAWLAPNASMQMFDIFILGHLLFGGIGVLGLFQRRGWHGAGAVLAGIIFMLGGSAAARLQHTGIIISYAWFPLAFWTLEAALDKRSYLLAGLFGVIAAFMTLGRDQVAYLMGLSLIFAVVWKILHAGRPLQWFWQRFGLLAVMAISGAAVLAVPVLLTLQFLGASNRPGISFGVAATGSLTPVNFITMLSPNFFGSLNWNYSYWGPGYETSSEPNWTDRSTNYLFLGTPAFVLVAWHGLGCGRLFTPTVRFFTVLITAATFYAIGRYSPVFALIFDLLPGVSLYRRPADATFLINFGFACASGYLLHRYIADGLPRLWPGLPRLAGYLLAASAAMLLLILAGYGLAFSLEFNHLAQSQLQLAVALAFCAGVVLILSVPSNGRARTLAACVLVAATMTELVWRDAGASFNAEPSANYSVFGELKPVEAAGLAALRKDIAARAELGELPRVEILGLSGPWQNASMVFMLENTLGYNPLRIADYERAVGPGENAEDATLRQFPGTFRGYRSKLASLLGLEYLVLDRPLAKLPRHFPRPLASQVFAGEKFYVYRLGKVAPRAYLANVVRPVDSEAALEEHVLPDFDRRNEVLVDNASMGALSQEVVRGDSNPALDPHVMIAAHHPDSSVIEVDTDRAGVLVLHDLYYPGWEVTVDSKPAVLLRANILFRGVEVPFGHHIVEFTFNPLSLENLGRALRGLVKGNDE